MRKLGLRRILRASSEFRNGNVRAFIIPKINFEASNYYEMVNWSELYSEPPLTKHIPIGDQNENIKNASYPKTASISLEWTNLVNIPCHSQAVERHVKLVSEASLQVICVVRRDEFFRSTLESRRRIVLSETKANYYRSEEPWYQ